MGDTCIPSLIVINNTINELETNIIILLPEAICCCLQNVMLQHQKKYWVKDGYQVLLSSTVQLTS